MTERARRADDVPTGPHISERSFGWSVLFAFFGSLLLAGLALTPTWIVRHGGGTAGTFTATHEDCHRKGCTLLGDFRAGDGSEVLHNQPLGGSIHEPAVGSPVAAREVFGGVYADPVSLTRSFGFYAAIGCIGGWLLFAAIWVVNQRADRRRAVRWASASRSPTLTRTRVHTRIGPPIGPVMGTGRPAAPRPRRAASGRTAAGRTAAGRTAAGRTAAGRTAVGQATAGQAARRRQFRTGGGTR